MRLSCRQLQGKVEELTEERSLQSSAAASTSLLSEIEQSMEAEELEQEREQVLMPLCAVRRSGRRLLTILGQHCTALDRGSRACRGPCGRRLGQRSAAEGTDALSRAPEHSVLCSVLCSVPPPCISSEVTQSPPAFAVHPSVPFVPVCLP